ncbi:FecCD family ABC transporter permease [Bacillus sp. AK031]
MSEEAAQSLQMNVQEHPFAKRRRVLLFLLSGLILLSLAFGVMTGAVSVSISEAVKGVVNAEDSFARRIVWDLRIPRVLIGFIVGMCLAAAGAILQGIMRNPLADPGIIGVSSGAGLVATFIMILFPTMIHFLPLGAFLGALLTTLIIYAMSWKRGASPVRIILVGVAVNALIGAVMSAIMLLYSDRVQAILPWLAGGIAGTGWLQFEMIIYYTLAAFALAMLSIKHIRILQLGDEVAKLLGHKVERSRFYLIILSSLLAGIAVSVSGLIGFVGLVVPHIIRLLIGNDFRYLLPFSAIGGGVLVVFADTLARTLFDPIELPVGILLSFIGGPFFMLLISRRRNDDASFG